MLGFVSQPNLRFLYFKHSLPLMALTIREERRKAQFYPEDLGSETTLDMVLIRGGKFLMGSPEDELDRHSDESPQHSVTVPTFFMGQFPVNQKQWRAVAALPKINRDLEPDPSNFKGGDRPVEQVSWLEAKEFCDRIEQRTSRPYRLPTEAEWEYACRAGTTTPFYYGKTITTELANYCGEDRESGDKEYSGSYGQGPKGNYRQETTSVGSFPANGFGLYDMHGNVWEWCEDHWHDNYESAPTDGTIWLDLEKKEPGYVMRGGSWDYAPWFCRSVSRGSNYAGTRHNDTGFRVVCSASRTS
jgi:formylglycine-generating enzyme required for sulfatase activity